MKNKILIDIKRQIKRKDAFEIVLYRNLIMDDRSLFKTINYALNHGFTIGSTDGNYFALIDPSRKEIFGNSRAFTYTKGEEDD